MDFPILTALVVIPAVSALIVALLPARRPEVVRLFGLLAATLTGALSIALLVNFDRETSGFQFVSFHEWIPEFGISWHLGVDGISLFLVVLTGVLFPIALFGVDAKQNYKAYTAWMLLLEAGCIGTFLSLDLFLFFVCFEIVLVPMYFIIGQWGHGDRVYAATKFFLFTMLGSAFMLVGIIATAILHQRGVGGDFTFNVVAIAEDPGIAQSTARWLFLAFAVAFAVKVPLFPVHTWLPDAHTNAPTAGSVILAAVHAEARHLRLHPIRPLPVPGSDGVLRAVDGHARGRSASPTGRSWRRCSATSNGSSPIRRSRTSASSSSARSRSPRQSLTGGVAQMVNHGLSTGALFLLVGMIYERRHTREIAKLNGLQKAAPIMAGFFMVVMLSSIGLPGLNGFVGEFLILLGSFVGARWWAVVAVTGVILAALYLLWAYQRVFHGEPDEANASMPDMNLHEWLDDDPARRPHRLPRRLPQADARTHRALGRPPPRAHRDPGAELHRADRR